MKEKLSQEWHGIPVYAWAAGGIALVLGLFYFMRRGTTTQQQSGAQAQPPQNIYSSTNVYNQPGSVPGANNPSVPPTPLRAPWYRQPMLRSPQPIPVNSASGLPGVTAAMGSVTGAAMQPFPHNPINWRPAQAFAQPSQSPVAPMTQWNLQPTAVYTQP